MFGRRTTTTCACGTISCACDLVLCSCDRCARIYMSLRCNGMARHCIGDRQNGNRLWRSCRCTRCCCNCLREEGSCDPDGCTCPRGSCDRNGTRCAYRAGRCSCTAARCEGFFATCICPQPSCTCNPAPGHTVAGRQTQEHEQGKGRITWVERYRQAASRRHHSRLHERKPALPEPFTQHGRVRRSARRTA